MVVFISIYTILLLTSILANLNSFIDFVTIDIFNEVLEIKPPALTTYIIILISVIIYPIMILVILKEDI